MSDFDRTNTFSLFKNDRKTKDTHPGYTGTLNVGGVEYYMNAWVKDGKSGKFFSGSIKAKDSVNHSTPIPSADDDDIPF